MLFNDNIDMAFNSFKQLPNFPYKIIESLIKNNSQEANDLWKLLKYSDIDCLEYDNLTYEEKLNLVCINNTKEQYYNVFLKPMIGDSIDTSDAQTQIRLYRYNTQPNSRFEAMVCFECDVITNEKTSLVRKDGIIMERTDLMECLILDLLNGRDIGIGSGILEFNRELSRSCNSQLTIGNSKTFYGRAIIFGLNFIASDIGGGCY